MADGLPEMFFCHQNQGISWTRHDQGLDDSGMLISMEGNGQEGCSPVIFENPQFKGFPVMGCVY